MRFLKGTSWGASKSPLLTIYRCLVRSLLEYGMEAYFFSARSHVVPLVKLQTEALGLCTGAMRSTPKLCLQHACNEMPLELKHHLLCSKYRAHLLTFPTHPTKTIIEDCWQELFPDFDNFCSFNNWRPASGECVAGSRRPSMVASPPQTGLLCFQIHATLRYHDSGAAFSVQAG